MSSLITGIQQVGIGVCDANKAKLLYKDLFAMDALIFDDKSSATLMAKYTGNTIYDRHAILSMNLSGGGGFEIWQFTSREPGQPDPFTFGDVGIFAAKIKSQNIELAYQHFSNKKNIAVSALFNGYGNQLHFWIRDEYGNNFNVTGSKEFFHSNNHICGGVTGAVIGVTNMKKAMSFYQNILELEEVVYDISGHHEDLPGNNDKIFRRVLLKKGKSCKGAFSKLLGDIQIELVEALEHSPKKIFENRIWGDCGFIHLCFDVLNMDDLKTKSENAGYHFGVDSKDSFPMETAAGRFCYVQDPDGTLIELVETHKVPILKKFGWHIDLKKRKNNDPLPDWMIKMLRFNKVK